MSVFSAAAGAGQHAAAALNTSVHRTTRETIRRQATIRLRTEGGRMARSSVRTSAEPVEAGSAGRGRTRTDRDRHICLLVRDDETTLEEVRGAFEIEAIELAIAVGQLHAHVVDEVPLDRRAHPPVRTA